ncbi:MAG: hypothetical protein WC789_00035 [Lentisphaeria bacterium]|jgi:hypothetical protein
MSTASLLDRVLPPAAGHTAIAPLFWQRGESPELIRSELRRMHAYGIDGVVVESRPHPDFLGPGWWRDLDAIVETGRELGMRVWVFDDQAYPTGGVAGAVPAHPAARKRFLRLIAIEAPGPVPGGRVLVTPWLGEDERLVAATAARLASDGTSLDAASLSDLGTALDHGALRWDVPPGRWRVILAVDTPRGGEEWTKDHLNPTEAAGVDLLLHTVYEPHFARYRADFGKTFAGFFSDEQRFGNAASYDAAIGRHPMVLPWGPTLETRLRQRWGDGFAGTLPLLGHSADAATAHTPHVPWATVWTPSSLAAVARARHAFMDEATLAWRAAWNRIGDWCRQHGVEWTGHICEDNNAHCRLGYGSGHFTRGLANMQVSGMDAVYQIQPDVRDGRCLSPFGDLDARFFYWGLTRMAVSAAHLDPAKRGVTLAECFGAYGWQCGLRGMVWLTNHLLARGVNRLVPHAWSMRFPDADCPPHFHALGNNPQSPHFPRWAAYAARLCRQLTGGEHRCEAAILYHAEAEWAGDCQYFQDVLRALAVRQLDGDVVAADLLTGPRVSAREGRLVVADGPNYACLILPWAERLPLAVLETAADLAEAGVPVFALRRLPDAAVDGDGRDALARLAAKAVVLDDATLAQALIDRGLATVTVEPPAERELLRLWRYRRCGRDLLLAVNEDTAAGMTATLRLPAGLPRPLAWDAMADAQAPLPARRRADGGWDVQLTLDANQALLLIAPGDGLDHLPLQPATACGDELQRLDRGWAVTTAVALAAPQAQPAITGPVDLTAVLPGFAGTVSYATAVQLDTAEVVLDLGEVQEVASVRLNGVPLGTRLTPPYRFALAPAARIGANQLEVEVVTTLAPAHGDNNFDRAWVQRPAGLIGPVRLCRAPSNYGC